MEGPVQAGIGTDDGVNGVNRAQRFDLEKKTIIESCFSKKDTDGSVLESYITHIRIIEDAAYPSSPPPPNSNPDGKKPRLIIVAVRKTGRVRMHKARENANGTFSIGKTWPLDDLTAVESFNNAVPATSEDERHKQWAGHTGFIVTIGKPYYWQASTPKEKQFFIASLVKIFIRYTGGKAPVLMGFEAREREQLLAPSVSGALPSRPPPRNTQSPTPSSQIVDASLQQSRQISQGPSPATTNSASQQQPVESRGLLKPSSSNPSFTDYDTPSHDLSSQSSAWREDPLSNTDIANVVAPLSGYGGSQEPSFRNPSQESLGKFGGNSRSQIPGAGSSLGSRMTSKEKANAALERSTTPISQRTFSTVNDERHGQNLSDTVELDTAALAPVMNGNYSVSPIRGQDSSLVLAPLISPFVRRSEADDRLLEIPVAQYMSNATRSGPAASRRPGIQLDDASGTDDRASADVAAESSMSAEVPTVAINPVVVQEIINRPGLGPMIKKKSKADIASSFRKAATVANAFKPRMGGAADRLKEVERTTTGESDGITGVVPAPSLVRATSNNAMVDRSIQPAPTPIPEAEPLAFPAGMNQVVPQAKDMLQSFEATDTIPSKVDSAHNKQFQDSPENRAVRKNKITSVRTLKELEHLGVETSFLDPRGIEFTMLLDQFGWVGHGVHTLNVDYMTSEIDREIQKAQAGGWLDRLEEEDDRVAAISRGLNVCLSECEELDDLLTLYSVELGTLSDDVAYIEAQSQGLQVQAANQKLLRLELDSLLNTISITDDQLQAIRTGSLRAHKDLEIAESQIATLFKAMSTIDPQLRLPESRNSSDVTALRLGTGRADVGNMQILKEKQIQYKHESNAFLGRLKREMLDVLKDSVREATKAMDSEANTIMSRRAGKPKIDGKLHESARSLLWRYSPLMLYTRLVNIDIWMDVLRMYEQIYKPLYSQELKSAASAWERLARKRGVEDIEFLFTAQIERQTDNVVTTTRKMTVKRAGTIGKALRSVGDNVGKIAVDKGQEGSVHPYEAFEGALEETFLLVSMEQNFIVEFFHASSLESSDFLDAVMMPPERRWGGDLRKVKPVDPDRNLAKIVLQSIEEMFSLFPEQVERLADLATSVDKLQLVGVLAAIERKLVDVQESNQEYLGRTLTKVQNSLNKRLEGLIEEQTRAIDDTKVKTKKRKGVIAFMRIFRNFSIHIESMLGDTEDLDIRQRINHAYERINKSMFESLKVIARDNPSVGTSASTAGDPEDKEALNYQILLIENMHYYEGEISVGDNSVLKQWKEKAETELQIHLGLYVGAVVRRPLGKLLDFVESVETQTKSLEYGISPTTIALRASHSKGKLRERLSAYDSKTIRKGLEELRRRVEKHFDHEEDTNTKTSKALVPKVLEQCEVFYQKLESRISDIVRDVYEGDAAIEWTGSDVTATLKR